MLNESFSIQEQTPSEKALITSALNLFIIQNESTINATQLIKAAGVSKAIFYKYFASKEDVYAAILLTDELLISPILKNFNPDGSLSDLFEQFLKFRVQHVERYRVLVRLEKHLLEKQSDLKRFKQWQLLRKQHFEEFSLIVETRLSRLEPVDAEQARFYYGLVWSIANGVANLSELDSFHELIADRRGFIRFIIDSMGRLGADL